ncbi:MAG: mevalonate kinase [Kiritimatiellia bacterium]
METIRTRSFARAGLLGNPSDGYFGKTLSFAFAQFGVDLTLVESSRIRFIQGEVDDATFGSMEELARNLRLYGYYGGIRLLKATAKRFFDYCRDHDVALPERNFAVEYKINIPRLVGLSGSSAICSAMLKALMRFYDVEIPLEVQPTVCLEAERDELGINCGFQDRVIQVYGGLVFMDFNRAYVEAHDRGVYEELDPACGGLNLYIAYDANRAEESGRAHQRVRRLFEAQNADVLAAMSEFADIAQQGRDLLVAAQAGKALADWQTRFAALVDANFDLRDRIFHVAEENRRMVLTARRSGASAKFAGSGGAIVGTYADEEQYRRLRSDLSEIGSVTFRPTVATRKDEAVEFADIGQWRNS